MWILLFVFFFVTVSSAQEKRILKNKVKNEVDSVRVIDNNNIKNSNDTLQTQDVVSDDKVEVIDTIPSSIPLTGHGSLSISSDIEKIKLNKRDLAFINYVSMPEIIYDQLPVYPLSLGGHGLFNHFSVFGGMPSGINFKYNGRDLSYLETGLFNPVQIPVEFLENIAFLTGSDAVIFGNNSSGALINIQEIRYNTAVPYTRMWLSQSAEDLFSVDGIFSLVKKKLDDLRRNELPPQLVHSDDSKEPPFKF